MKITPLSIAGAYLASSPVFKDDRGFFREWFKSADIEGLSDLKFEVAQANISQSSKGTIRGIHYSTAIGGQAKWVTCVAGAINDFVVDIRPDSETYGAWVEIELTAENGNAVFIGGNLGHAFVSLEDGSAVSYLVSSEYSPDNEFEINPLDPKIAINWKLDLADMKISEKDKNAPTLEERRKQGKLPMMAIRSARETAP